MNEDQRNEAIKIFSDNLDGSFEVYFLHIKPEAKKQQVDYIKSLITVHFATKVIDSELFSLDEDLDVSINAIMKVLGYSENPKISQILTQLYFQSVSEIVEQYAMPSSYIGVFCLLGPRILQIYCWRYYTDDQGYALLAKQLIQSIH